MLSHHNVLVSGFKKQLLVVALFLVTSTSGQWSEPWLVEPPNNENSAYGHVTITGGNTINAEENINAGSILAALKFTDSNQPILSGCSSTIRVGSANVSEAYIYSQRTYDFEKDLISENCVVYILLTNGSTLVKPLYFKMVDLNDNFPRFVNTTQSTLQFEENKKGMIYDFDGTDVDTNDVLRYTMKVTVGDGSSFELEETTGKLNVINDLDYEKEQFYLFTIELRDKVDHLTPLQVGLNVIDVRDRNPDWIIQKPFINIPEEQDIDTLEFQVKAQDGDSFNDAIVYSLEDPKKTFDIDSATGLVRLIKKIDRDVIDFDPYFDLNITAKCQSAPTFQSFTLSTVFIDDINDNLPVFDQPVYEVNVDENYVGRLSDLEITVSDPDLKVGGSYSVKLEGPDEIIQHLELSPTTGRNTRIFFLKINSSSLLDYEDVLKRNINITIVATEDSETKLSSKSEINIFSKDLNDNSPIFKENEYTATIQENKGANDFVIQVEANDIDVSPEFGNDSIRFSFVENFDAARYFTIDSTTGEIKTAVDINRESIGTSSFTYNIEAIDNYGGSDARRSYVKITINIADTNDNPPEFSSLTTSSFQFSEDTTTGTEVVPVSASDRDENPDLKLTINWSNSKFLKNRAILTTKPEWNQTFLVDSVLRITETNIQGIVKVGSSLDWESFDSVQLCLRVTDDNTENGTNYDEIFIAIDILDINDNDPIFDPPGNFEIQENNSTAIGTVIGFVRATDADENNTITYSLDSSCTKVAINPTTGQLKTAALFDYEEESSIDCIITATDSGIPPGSTTTTITVRVIDINDNKPELTVSVNPIEIYECAEGSQETIQDMLISQLSATDKDSGDYGTVSYLMFQNNFEGVDEFDINNSTGEITVRNCALLDYDKKTNYTFTVEARDNYRSGITTGSNSAFEQITVRLKDLNDNKPIIQFPGIDDCFASPLESDILDEVVVTITGQDQDSVGPNKWMTFTLNEQIRVSEPKPNCDNLFRMETGTDNSSGRLIVDKNMLNCNGKYDINVKACDQGDEFFGVQCSQNSTYRICVFDVNNNAPQFIFPNPDGSSVIGVPENSTVDLILIYDGNKELIFEATDIDEEVNGDVRYSWKEPTEVFNLDPIKGEVKLAKKLDRSVQSSYNLTVVATDTGVPPLSSGETKLRINVRLSEEHPPFFETNTQTLDYKENRIESKSFQVAVHPDNGNLYPGESPYDFCYFAICGNTEYFQVPNKTINGLATKKELDRESPLDIPYVIIMTTNDCETQQPPKPCSEIDMTEKKYLNISIQILDENDCGPEFSSSLSGGITSGNKKGDIVFPMKITDKDENDIVTCEILQDYKFSDNSLANVVKPPFRIDESQQIILEFDVQSSMKGFFTMTVKCQDKAEHVNQTPIKIYIITDANKIDIVFDDPLDEVESKRAIIEDIFTTTLGYSCNIEKVTNYEGSPDTKYVTALSHFINTTTDEPILVEEIVALTVTDAIGSLLVVRCLEQSLNLKSVGPIITVTDNTEAIFQILFIIACIAIVLMIAAVIYLIIRRAELNRRVKALSTNNFGSQQSGMEKIGEIVPTSNQHAVEGSNPIFSLEASAYSNHDDNFDNISESSGDSVLIGVEDNPEFRNYKPNGKANGYNHNVSSLPFQNVSRRNPLMDDNSKPEPSYAPSPLPSERSTKRPAPPPPLSSSITEEEDIGEMEDIEEMEDAMNSNFSFGASMTEM